MNAPMIEPITCQESPIELPYGYQDEVSMTAISLKLPDELLEVSDRCARTLDLTRAEYIRRAIDRANRETERLVRARRLSDVSRKVRSESMRVNAEFAAIERDIDA